MQIFKTKQELSTFIDKVKKDNRIGFVPTMGALHEGHLSLVRCSLKSTDKTIVSIFVNPTQFNNLDDLKKYPRDIDRDIEMLEKEGVHVVFAPSEQEMYPKEDNRVFDFDGIDKVMEGQYREGHFNGVAQIVSKLFDAVQPHEVFLGQKDFQQVSIIKKMVEKLNYDIKIVSCPIIREKDGLAMSSRNALLKKQYREEAILINKVLQESITIFNNYKDIERVKEWVIREINKSTLLELEYFDVVDGATLKESNTVDDNLVGCVAVWAGDVRLIDNVILNS
jgi:pantoate--beta-alanine ligase